MVRNIYFTKFQSLLWFGILFWGGFGGELNMRILRIQKRFIRSKVGVSSRTSCRQLFKELNILTLALLYIYIHNYNTRRKMDIHSQSYKTDIYKKNVINMGTKVYNKLPGYIKETDSYKAFKKELKLFLLLHTFYSMEEFISL
jgi:hypothetical protein